MNLDRVIAVRTNETVYRDGMQCVKVFGDGFTNSFYPTSTTLLMVTGLVGIPLNKWYRWTWKLLLAVMVIVAVTLLICVKINFGPF